MLYIKLNYRIDKFTRIFSSVAECPCDVNSIIISQSASGNGVNCPCAVGATIQSSMSPENYLIKKLKLLN